MTSLLILVFLFLAMGACFVERLGSEAAFQQALFSTILWGGWMYFVAIRRPPPFDLWGLIRGLAPWFGLVLCYSLMKPLVPVLHPQLFDADLHGVDLRLMGRGPSLWQQVLLGGPT